MEWSDDAIVLSLRAHGESSGILEALTRDHGRHLGLVRGGGSSKGRAVMQPGNRVKLVWRAPLSRPPCVFSGQPGPARAADIFQHPPAPSGLHPPSARPAPGLPPPRPP